MKNGRFYVGLVGVGAVVSYLVWTGISDSMVYYVTPTELVARVAQDSTYYEVGVRVSGWVVPGSYDQGEGDLVHLFTLRDIMDEQVAFPVVYVGVLPETCTEDMEVVMVGPFGGDGTFRAKTLMTKCGSRYEASAEELANRGATE